MMTCSAWKPMKMIGARMSHSWSVCSRNAWSWETRTTSWYAPDSVRTSQAHHTTSVAASVPPTIHASFVFTRRRALAAGRRDAEVLRQPGGGRGDVVEARAVLPQDLAADLRTERQAEEFVHRVGKRAVGMRIVGRDDEVVGAHLVHDVDRRLLVHVERDVALTLEVFARQHRELVLAARAELLPLVVEPPEPPVEPAGGALEEGAAQPGMALEDAAGGHAGDRSHQLDGVANGVRDRVEVRVADVAPSGVVLERRVAGRMKPDRHVELLERAPQRVARLVVQVLAVDRIRGADDRDGAELLDAPARLVDRRRDAVHRHLRGELQPGRLALAVVGRPVVVGARQRGRVVGGE